MFEYHRALPTLDNAIKTGLSSKNDISHIEKLKSKQSTTTFQSDTISLKEESQKNKDFPHPINLPPVVSNSTLVRQRASAKDILAAASVSTGASLPLMIGGRSKCVVNVVAGNEDDISTFKNRSTGLVGPQNAALRAEHRKQNMISIVRPVVNTTSDDLSLDTRQARFDISTDMSHISSILDDFMNAEMRAHSTHTSSSNSNFNEILGTTNRFNEASGINNYVNESQAKQNSILLRREETELNRGIRRQHRFVAAKIAERRKGLQIVHSVWIQRDFKHAIEKLVDLYHQGLMFTYEDGLESMQVKRETQLSSLNTPLVVDVIGVIILRPNLWNLEVCQLLLPIIVNDLLSQTSVKYENYLETALKSLKLILNHFSAVIKTTLESQNNPTKFTGVDLSREDRLSKCWNCYGLLLEAAALISTHVKSSNGSGKVATLQRETLQLFSSFQASLEPNVVDFAIRRQKNANQ